MPGKVAVIGGYEDNVIHGPGYEIEDVKVKAGGYIQLDIGNKIVVIYPADDNTPEYIDGDTWSIKATDSTGVTREVIRFDVKQGYTATIDAQV